MAVNPMQRKTRNAFLLGMLIMLVVGGAAVGFLIYHITGLNDKIALKEAKSAYILTQDVKSGEVIDLNKVMLVKMQYAPANYLNATQLSDEQNVLKAKTQLTSGVVLSQDMVYIAGEEETKDMRIVEYNMITLPSKLENGDYIDVRLTLPSGQDYIVLSKKQIIKCDEDTIWIKVSEDEILYMNNAIVESYQMLGSSLNAVIYSEAGMQDAAIPNYSLSSAVEETLATDPNILEEAKAAYNNRNAEDVSKIRTSIERALSQYSADKKENIEEGVETSREKTKEKRLLYIDTLDVY